MSTCNKAEAAKIFQFFLKHSIPYSSLKVVNANWNVNQLIQLAQKHGEHHHNLANVRDRSKSLSQHGFNQACVDYALQQRALSEQKRKTQRVQRRTMFGFGKRRKSRKRRIKSSKRINRSKRKKSSRKQIKRRKNKRSSARISKKKKRSR